MNSLKFSLPIRIKPGLAAHVCEIYDVEAAQIFLRNWPTGRLGPMYQRAMGSCTAAMKGQAATEEALKDFVSFARVAGILADDDGHQIASDEGGENKVVI
ncbi:DUF982 domain-containing protein [Mesorhizobium sp. CCNWLW179-1]|uniref:DUF982 domain-containing protein n=1 Tax=unclassified Mesorhizobium TaxID=325217 RepID=UPI0030141F3F